PLITERYPNDADGDRIDDRLADRARAALVAQHAAVTSAERSEARARVSGMVDVELIFKEPVTQNQIDAFLSLGGEITYIYKAVSYGWNGRIPLNRLPALPVAMGDFLVLIDEPATTQCIMDEATVAGRVRPLWVPGFAGNNTGFSGTTNITIAFVDT